MSEPAVNLTKTLTNTLSAFERCKPKEFVFLIMDEYKKMISFLDGMDDKTRTTYANGLCDDIMAMYNAYAEAAGDDRARNYDKLRHLEEDAVIDMYTIDTKIRTEHTDFFSRYMNTIREKLAVAFTDHNLRRVFFHAYKEYAEAMVDSSSWGMAELRKRIEKLKATPPIEVLKPLLRSMQRVIDDKVTIPVVEVANAVVDETTRNMSDSIARYVRYSRATGAKTILKYEDLLTLDDDEWIKFMEYDYMHEKAGESEMREEYRKVKCAKWKEALQHPTLRSKYCYLLKGMTKKMLDNLTEACNVINPPANTAVDGGESNE